MQGPWKAFTYTVPNPDGSTTSVLVTFEQTLEDCSNARRTDWKLGRLCPL